MVECVGEDYSTIAAITRTGGIVPDATWQATRDGMVAAADVAEALGLKLVTFHAGFIPHDTNDPTYATVTGRLIDVADIFAKANCRVALETGQESAGDAGRSPTPARSRRSRRELRPGEHDPCTAAATRSTPCASSCRSSGRFTSRTRLLPISRVRNGATKCPSAEARSIGRRSSRCSTMPGMTAIWFSSAKPATSRVADVKEGVNFVASI